MKFLLDHDVPKDLSYVLEQLGHDVTPLRRALVPDVSDEAVLQFAYEQGCVLLTCNRDDFLQLATKKLHHGIVIRRHRCPASNAGGPKGRHCIESWSALGRPGSRTISTSPNHYELCPAPRGSLQFEKAVK